METWEDNYRYFYNFTCLLTHRWLAAKNLERNPACRVLIRRETIVAWHDGFGIINLPTFDHKDDASWKKATHRNSICKKSQSVESWRRRTPTLIPKINFLMSSSKWVLPMCSNCSSIQWASLSWWCSWNKPNLLIDQTTKPQGRYSFALLNFLDDITVNNTKLEGGTFPTCL